MASKLFQPVSLGGLDLPNRIMVAAMCQYSAHEGVPNDWHLMHLGQFAVSGAGIVFTEATGTEAAGRITPGCTGLYNDAQEEAWARVIRFFRDYGSAKIGRAARRLALSRAPGRPAVLPRCPTPMDGTGRKPWTRRAWRG